MSLSRAFTKAVNKATYDPEFEKQLAAERAKARELRAKLRQTLTEYSNKNRELVSKNELTPQGSTLATSLIQETTKWLQDTPDATEAELQDKLSEVLDKLATIYNEDKNRLMFSNWLKSWDVIVATWQGQNKISEDKAKKIKELLAKDKDWYSKNLNESLETYKERMDKDTQDIYTIVGDATLIQDAGDQKKAQDSKSVDLDELKAKIEAEKKAKEEVEKEQFSLSRLFSKIGKGVGVAFLIALFIAFGLTGGSLLSNEAIARPVPYRILYFIFGFLFSIPVIIFYIGRTFMGHPPYYAAYLLPLYSYDPLKEDHSSFFESLVWFKDNAVVRDAVEKFQEKATAVQSMRLVRG
jgi:lipopolysaccharide export LptBFGC system permease protein LptF